MSAYTLYNFIDTQRSVFPFIEGYATHVLDESVEKMDTQFKLLERVAQCVQGYIDSDDVNLETAPDYLKRLLNQYSYIYGIGVFLKPFTLTSDKKLFGPYVTRSEDKEIELRNIEDSFDYTKREFFVKGIKKKQWLDPYFGPISQKMLAEFVMPLYKTNKEGEKEVIGSLAVSYDLKTLQKIASQLQLEQTGYGFIASAEGTYVAHPIKDYLSTEKTMMDIAEETENNELKALFKQSQEEQEGYKDYKDPLTGTNTWIFFKKIPSNNWTLFISFVTREVLVGYSEKYRTTLMHFIGSLILFLFFLFTIIAKLYSANTRHLWYWSGVISLLFISGIGTIWYIQIELTPLTRDDRTRITNRASLNTFLKEHVNQNKVITIPTGLYIDYIELPGLNEAEVNGVLWQHYPIEKDKEIPQGFMFPRAMTLDKKVVINTSTEKKHITSWNFYSKIYQQFDYKKFPFDYKHVYIEIKPEDTQHNILLTPDLSSYTLTNPTSLPGINPRINMPSWTILKSYFSYRHSDPLEDSQLSVFLGEDKTPKFFFNVMLQRSFIHSFISYIVPLMLALTFLFFVLRSAAYGKKPEKVSINDLLTPGGLTISIFFAVIVSHVSLRGTLPEQPLFYLEYFYIITYIFMLFVLATIFGMVTKSDLLFIRYKQMLLPQIMYGPLLFGMFLSVTYWVFY
jgi:hypothetical protein